MFKFFHGAPYAVCVELKNFYLFVFCFGGLLFVACVGVCGCVRGWVLLGWATYGSLCDGICGESRDV